MMHHQWIGVSPNKLGQSINELLNFQNSVVLKNQGVRQVCGMNKIDEF